jgi:adenosylcobinamide kinase/adenosylcobinamide-phosphate guanylyltransferase
MGRLTFILGGARSGKSSYAERLAQETGEQVLYIATAQALDDEMSSRIRAHQAKRLAAWQTLEAPIGVAGALASHPGSFCDVVLLDCLTLLVSNLLLNTCGADGEPDPPAASIAVEAEISSLLTVIQTSRASWIVVSNEVGMGLVPPYPLGRLYRDLLGWANQRMAGSANEVLLMIAGLPWKLSPPGR